MHDEGETETAPSRRVLEHLQVAIGISECRNWDATYMLVDAHWFAGSVVDEVDFRQAQEHRLSVPQLEPGRAAAANDVFGRDAVNSLRPWPHEINTTPRDDERFEAVRLRGVAFLSLYFTAWWCKLRTRKK
jgi:hypothetical protein